MNKNNATGDKETKKKGKRQSPAYDTNPSLAPAAAIATGSKRYVSKDKKASFSIIDNDGVLVGAAGFHKIVEVDPTQFIKLYVTGVQAIAGLSKCATKLFEIIVSEMAKNKNKDNLFINHVVAATYGLSRTTYQRGINELLDREFIYTSSLGLGWFFINVTYIFNGDRLAFLQEYRRVDNLKPNNKALPIHPDQQQLPL